MMLRVLGTVAGVTIGVALALLTPDNTVLRRPVCGSVHLFDHLFFAGLLPAEWSSG